ncbi:Autophagy-related protein 17 [Lasallia pustulata]|uniref:Autophagy-related protein 11 n=1 Tax=Lasallia pustulata TaxID=136370 RepID=A0A1W5DD19_9LECA|nr:Autophagy-related protein 17 [Lasallia pustulata]
MSLHIFNAHTGQCLKTNPVSFISLDSLKAWIAGSTSIAINRQILMTARGKQVKLQTLVTEKELFVYDRQLLFTSHDPHKSALSKDDTPPSFSPRKPPDSLTNENDLQAWQNLFRDRRAWAIEIVELCARMVGDIRAFQADTAAVQRGAAIAVENLKQHIGTLQQKHENSQAWGRDILQDQATLLEQWEEASTKLSAIPAKGELRKFLRVSYPTAQKIGSDADSQSGSTLRNFIDMDAVKKAAEAGSAISRRFTNRLSDLVNTFEDVTIESNQLIESFSQAFATSTSDAREDSHRLMEEVEVVAKKINSDYEHVLGLPKAQKSISQVSKTALLHTRNFLPSLEETSSDIDQLLRHAVEQKYNTMATALNYMQQISAIESTLSRMQPQMATLEVGDEANEYFDTISFLTNLPAIYGSLLVESVRRREWNEKMTADSSTLAEEMATFREEEEKRRKKWLRSMGDIVRPEMAEDQALGVEVNLQANQQRWPLTDRDEIATFLQTLKELGGFDEVVQEVEEFSRALSIPTRQQSRRANAFKNGSIHDAAFGRNSLLLREDDEVRTLKNKNSKLEDRLKGSESRVRKLEDLLHRQSQDVRIPTGTGQGLERHPTSPVLTTNTPSPKPQDTMARRSSTSSRRFSANNGLEERALVKRIVSLEAELDNEKAHSVGLESDAALSLKTEHELRSQVQDAVSTKKDLMENMEAQQREFEDERHLLEEELTKLKVKLEEVEDELDRLLGSRDHEKAGVDDRVRAFEVELDRLRRESAEQVQKAQGQTEFLRNDYTMQREKANKLEHKVLQQEEEIAEMKVKAMELETRLKNRDEAQKDHRRALLATHLQLTQNEPAPEDFTALVKAVEILAERSVDHLREIEQACETLRSDNLALESRLQDENGEAKRLRNTLSVKEKEVITIKESQAEAQARLVSLQSELEDQRQELSKLREQFAAGETGSEVLRARIAEEEKKCGEVSAALAAAEAHVRSLKGELENEQAKLEELDKLHGILALHFDARGVRSADLSRRLSLQNDRLVRLLEHLGFTVLKQDDSMVFQRTARATSASTTLNDISMSMNRSLSGPLPTKSTFEECVDFDGLQWAKARDADVEAREFSAYTRHIEEFNLDAFSEALIKRIKETEHTARKWQKEARAYRDKSHRAQSEAHEKIAFRSFKEGDLALFLPTRNQATRPWAAFNVGAPHYFLREQDSHKLRTRDWLLARISKVEERVVDLSKSINALNPASDRRSIGETSDGGASFDDENPFELSDGLRWYLLDALEEKPGAPSTPGLGKSTVASANVDVRGSIRMKKASSGNGATKTLTKSLDNRRGSSASKQGVSGIMVDPGANGGSAEALQRSASTSVPKDTQHGHRSEEHGVKSRTSDEVRTDLLWGP